MEWATIWSAVAAVAAVGTGVVAWRAIEPARRGIEVAVDSLAEARKARRVTLVLDLSEKFSSEDMHKALTYLGRRRDQFNGDVKAMVAAYVTEVSATSNDQVPDWNLCRRRVSKFFIRARVLCTAGLLDEGLLAESLQKAAFDLCVDTVGPLDEAQNRQVLKRTDFDDRMIAFFRGFRERHFGKRDA